MKKQFRKSFNLKTLNQSGFERKIMN